MKAHKIILGIMIVCFTFLAWWVSAYSATNYSLSNGSSASITEWGTCYSITNNSGKTLFIPTKTSAEWSSFYSRNLGGITKTLCGCSASGACGAAGNGATCSTYSAGSVSYGLSCPGATVSTCMNGTWSPAPYSNSSCSVQAPQGCWSSPGSCNYGYINTSGYCTASDPAYYGQSCASAPNSCGQVNYGTYDCSANCSASTPSNGSCPIYGCTDPNGFNYNPSANSNDGSCHYNGCYDVQVDHYNVWTQDVMYICQTQLYSGDYSDTVVRSCLSVGDCNYWNSQEAGNVGACMDAYSSPYYVDRILSVGSPYACN